MFHGRRLIRTAWSFIPAIACLAGCPDRPIQTTDDLPGTSAGTTNDQPTGTTGSTTGTTGSTSGTSEPADTTGSATTTSAGSTTGAPDSTGEPADTTDAASSTSGGTPASCGPPCDETWEQFGDLNVEGADDFTCLTRVHGNLWMGDKAEPASIASLANLRTVDGTMRIRHPSLTDLSAFACLEKVGELQIVASPQLAEPALPGLTTAPVVELNSTGATKLPSFAANFGGIRRLSLIANAKLVDLSPASSWGLWTDELTVLMHGNAALASLSGLGGLIEANGANDLFLQVIDHAALTSLAGLESVTHASLYLAQLPALADLDPLKKLTTGAISLVDIPKVTDLSGLSGLTSATQLMIGDCVNMGSGGMNGLTSLAGLDSLTSVGSFALANNDNLASLSGAPKLTSVDGLEVVNNDKLTQQAFDAFVAQLDAPPDSCFGGWDVCECFVILPW